MKIQIVLQKTDNPDLKNNGETISFILMNLCLRYFIHVNYDGDLGPLQHQIIGDYLETLLTEKKFNSQPTHLVIIGERALSEDEIKSDIGEIFYVMSSGWTSYLSRTAPVDWSEIESNHLVAAFTAALVFGELFKSVVKDDVVNIELRDEYTFSFIDSNEIPVNLPKLPNSLDINLVMVGAGGVGQSIAYLLNQFDLFGNIRFIDHDQIDVSNLQRYILTTPRTIGVPKSILLNNYFSKQHFLYRNYNIQQWNVALTLVPSLFSSEEIIISIDNKRGRNEVQASLPKIIWNAWTGTAEGELTYGFGKHEFGNSYECLACVYFPKVNNSSTQKEFNARILGLTAQQLQSKIDQNMTFSEKDLKYSLQKFTLSPQHQNLVREQIGKSFGEIFHGQCGLLQSKIGEGRVPTPAPHVPTLSACVLVIHRILADLGHTQDVLDYTVGEYSAFHYPSNHSRFRSHAKVGCICSDPAYIQVYQKKW